MMKAASTSTTVRASAGASLSKQLLTTPTSFRAQLLHGPAYFIWPIEDPAHVNERRKKAGFEQTVAQNAQRLDIKYQVLTLDDVHKMPGYQPPAP